MAPPTGINHIDIANPCIYERKSRFTKWLSKLFKGGSSSRGGGGRPPPQLHGEENVVWRAPSRPLDDHRARKEKEELDRASAVSLPQDLRKPGPSGYRRQTNNDEEHRWKPNIDEDQAKALWDSLNSPPHHAPAHYFPWNSYRICSGCHQDISYGNYLGWMGKYFHPGCFRCYHCRAPITESEFSLSENGGPFHKSCFKELSHPKCEVCLQFIPTNASGLIEYRCHPFWSQKYCPSHEHDNTARCCSCERLESWNARYYSLEDGRSLCFECTESAIMDTGDCQPLYHAIRDYYEGMNMRLDQQIPMLLVERQALNEAIVGEKNGYHHMPETRGLCLSEEQTVASIHKRPRIGGRRLVGIKTQPHKLTRKCEVTAILVLYGLPRLLTGGILAHELMHGWLRLKGYRNLNPEVEEGICQVLSYMWLESELLPGAEDMPSTSTGASSSSYSSKKGLKSDVENKLGKFFMHQIAHDASTAYGGGFRAANEAVNKYGLRATLNHIRLTGSFPL